MGLEVALNLSYHQTAPYVKPYVMEELQGLADSTHGAVSLVDVRNVMWLGEITRGSCSMFGAKDSATHESRGGKLLQLRALDWDTDGPFKNYASIVVYHPSDESSGHAWANVGFAGWTASITGFSSTQLALSEIGVSYPDSSFGPETYLAKGYPFGYIIRDMLQFDRTLEEATERIQKATRTCDLILVSSPINQHQRYRHQHAVVPPLTRCCTLVPPRIRTSYRRPVFSRFARWLACLSILLTLAR